MKIFLLALLLALPALSAQPPTAAELFGPQNLHAWCVVPFDAKQRGPEERAAMLEKLGFHRFVYDWRAKDVPAFDTELDAMKKHGIEVTGWWSPTDPRDPILPATLAIFQRHAVHPQLWVMGGGAPTKSPEEQAQRIESEAQRIREIAALAAPCGCPVELYNHNGWFGQPDNEVAILQQLEKLGVKGVGMVYNFSHGHGDIADFPAIWKRIQPYVVAVNVTGMKKGGGEAIVPPSQGDEELAMMRVILESGWRGPVGLIAEQGGDAEVTLARGLQGMAWLTKELAQPGSGGARPNFEGVPIAAASPALPAAAPLNPAAHPFASARVNRDRIYDFYAKEAIASVASGEPAAILPAFPGLDSGRFGHWGNQNEATWASNVWNEMDLGSLQAGVFHYPAGTVPRAVCVRLDGAAACFDADALAWRHAWSGGFLHFDTARSGLLGGLKPEGSPVALPPSEPAEPGTFVYHGFYRHDSEVIFAYSRHGEEWLEEAVNEKGELHLQREHPGEGRLSTLTHGGAAQWPQRFETQGQLGSERPYAFDTLALPAATPWHSIFHFTGQDFLPSGEAALCTIEGEVWIVSGIDEGLAHLTWRRFASGLHQPLGLRVVDGAICVLGRDQITRLHDLDGDGEADFYECLSRPYETPTGGHDFVTGLQHDSGGRFYLASGKQGVVRISADGQSAEVLATGLRNPNGLGLGPNGEIAVAAQEGEWTPASMVYEFMPDSTAPPPHFGYGGPKPGPRGHVPPLAYLPRGEDNSCGGQCYVEGTRWGAAPGTLLHFSWGNGTMFLILRESLPSPKEAAASETAEATAQGCVIPLPGDFRSGPHRGQFNPRDGQLYVVGMAGWGNYSPEPGCFQRVRYTGGPEQAPVATEAHENGVLLRFAQPLDPAASDAKRFFAQEWSYRYSAAYGSEEYSVRQPAQRGHDRLEITSSHLLEEGRVLFLEIPQLQPANVLHLHAGLPALVSSEFYLTLHRLEPAFTEFPGYQAIPKTPIAVRAEHDMAAMPTGPATPVRWEQGAPGRALRIEAASGLQYAQKELHAKAGERLSLTFANPDAMPHNWVLLNPGAMERVGDLANKLIAEPDAWARNYVPASPEVLCHTRILEPLKTTTIHFDAPKEPGRYPYMCTFPGHWMLMHGELVVE